MESGKYMTAYCKKRGRSKRGMLLRFSKVVLFICVVGSCFVSSLSHITTS